MGVKDLYIEVREYWKMLQNANAFATGRMDHAGAHFYQLLGSLKDMLLVPANISNDFLLFIAQPDNLGELGPIIDTIQPEEDRKWIRYNLGVAITTRIDKLTQEGQARRQGFGDPISLASLRKLNKYLTDYYAQS